MENDDEYNNSKKGEVNNTFDLIRMFGLENISSKSRRTSVI